MNKIYSISIYNNKELKTSEYNFPYTWSLVYDSSAKKMIDNGTKIIAYKMDKELYMNIAMDEDNKSNKLICHFSYFNDTNIQVLTVTNNYKSNNLICNMMKEINIEYSKQKNINMFIKNQIKKYEKPEEFDKTTMIQGTIEDTKKILLITMTKLIERGEKLQTLEDKSIELEEMARIWKKDTEKLNRCCVIL